MEREKKKKDLLGKEVTTQNLNQATIHNKSPWHA